MYDLIIPHLHSKAPLPYLPNFVNCFCTKIQHFSSCIQLFVPYSKRNRRFFVLFVQKPPPPPSPEYAKNKTRTIAWSRSYWWARVDSNHRSIKQQIYSLSPLATREHAHILFYRAGVLPGDLFILPQALLFVNSFFKLFRSSAPGCRSDRQRAAGPYPVVQPAAPDCLLILAPAGAFVNREFAFWGGIVVS